MASKKINWNMACKIADKIAAKAFEHLTAPLERELGIIAAEAWAIFAAKFDFPALAEHDFVKVTDTLTITLYSSRYGNDESSVRVTHRGKAYKGLPWDDPSLTDDALDERAFPVRGRLAELVTSRGKLANTLRNQLNGKTSSQAMKAWPEAAQIIAECCDLDNPVRQFTVPLETLLAKFLPLLPAPQGE